jgi:signal transduction histidine kinase
LTLAITKYHLFNTKVILTELLVIFMGFVLLAVPFSMPTITLKILTGVVFVLFCIFGYYLIEVAHKENERREFAEKIAAEERVLREDAEAMAGRERVLRREAEKLAGELKRLDAAKTQFLLSTQHHLRSPLSVIQGYLSMIGEGDYGKISAKAKEKIDASLGETQKLIRLVNDLLDVAHFQMNKDTTVKELTDIVNLIGGVAADLENSALSKKIYLRFKKPETPIAEVAIDSRGIREAIYNIIDNAIKYTQEGGVTVAVGAATNKLRISVADTGIGMDEKDRQGLFGRTFERGEKAKTANVNGKGIGLYLAAQMIINNGGTIRVESQGLGKGSQFIIELPINSAKPMAYS